MKGIKKGLLAGMVLCCMPVLSACSFRETLGVLWNSEDKVEKENEEVTAVKEEVKTVDDSVEIPVLANELGEPVTYGRNGTAEPLMIQASVSDGGTLSYQWYRNNVDSNGGGTAIEGAVESSFTPPTAEPGTTYYYVVVTNTVGKGIQLCTSTTKCVTVTEEEAAQTVTAEDPAVQDPAAAQQAPAEVPDAQGTWQQDEMGIWFQYPDGTAPVNKWEKIGGKWYAFNENGRIRTGWYQEGENWYYLYEDGSRAQDTDVEGYHLGPDGIRQ